MLTQQVQEGNFNLGTREPWQVFEQERSTGLVASAHLEGPSLPRASIAGSTTVAVLPELLGQTTTPTGYNLAASSRANFLGPAGLGNSKRSTSSGCETAPPASCVMTRRPRSLGGATGWQRRAPISLPRD